MRFGWSRIMVCFGVVSTLIVGTSSLVLGQEVLTGAQSFAKQGMYLTILASHNEISGDFDGQTLLAAPTEIVLVPEVQGNWGGGISFGWRGHRWAGELTYMSSEHDATWLGAIGEVTYRQLSFDFKGYFRADKQLQPYLLFGWIPFADLVAKDGSASATAIGDATFKSAATGLNLGGGLAFYVNPKISFHGSVIYRLIEFDSATGVEGVSRPIVDPLDGSGVNYQIGISFTF